MTFHVGRERHMVCHGFVFIDRHSALCWVYSTYKFVKGAIISWSELFQLLRFCGLVSDRVSCMNPQVA